MVSWRLVLLLVAMVVPGGSLILLLWAGAKALLSHREVMLQRPQVALARPPVVGAPQESLRAGDPGSARP